MDLLTFCQKMPKVELHVHLEGSIRPETVLKLARKNGVSLPADDLEGLRDWYAFRNFKHFVEVYVAVTKCIKDVDDLDLVIREFVEGQKDQNILHTEATYTASTIARFVGIPWEEQERALLRGIEYANQVGVSLGFIVDIVRGDTPEGAMQVASWATGSDAVLALGLAGEEHRGTKVYQECFDLAAKVAKPVIPHAGETMGPESIWETIEATRPKRIGHGVRCIEDPELVKLLRDKAVPLEVCPSSNVALGVYSSLEEHPLPKLLDEGLYVTINSDDPPMFGTSLSEEFARCADAFEFNEDILWSLTLNAAKASLIAPRERDNLVQKMSAEFSNLQQTTNAHFPSVHKGL